MMFRMGACLAVLLACGCWPHETRPLTELERGIVDDLCALVEGHARRTNDPTDLAVARAVQEAREAGRIGAFMDEPQLPDGKLWHGAVVLDRLYLHENLLRGRIPPGSPLCPYPLEMIYHEGFHLTQSCTDRLFSPKACEDEAQEETRRFLWAWRPDPR